jgi:hypothetical protein
MEAVARKKARGTNGNGPQVEVRPIEFTAAAHEYTEGPFFDNSYNLGANVINIPPIDLPSYGFMRHVVIQVTSSGGTAGTAAATADAPWTIFSEIALLDTNGTPFFQLSGYNTFLANLYGGYSFLTDPRLAPDYSAAVTAENLILRVPIEVFHNNGLGSLPNQNAAAPYRIRVQLNTLANLMTIGTGTAPTYRIRMFMESWTQPEPTDAAGRPQYQAPPRLGTTQSWSQNPAVAVNAGAQVVRIGRMGNLLRNVILVGRTAGGVRTAATLPDPVTLRWDAKELNIDSVFLRRWYMAERFVHFTSTTGVPQVPLGVMVYSYTHDLLGHGGDGTPELFLPTVQSTRFEFTGGNWGAGLVDQIINDVAPAEIEQDERYYFENESGFAPEVGVPVRRP